MTWWDAEPLARAGTPVRRSSWLQDGGLLTKRIVYSAGAGTTRAVAMQRNATSETLIINTAFTAADFLADDWELAT